MSLPFLDEFQVDELESLIEDSMFDLDEDDFESITETDEGDWSGIEYDF